MIAQPLLSTYFNLVYEDAIFTDNMYFLDILKQQNTMFIQPPNDQSKYNNKKRFKISEFYKHF